MLIGDLRWLIEDAWRNAHKEKEDLVLRNIYGGRRHMALDSGALWMRDMTQT